MATRRKYRTPQGYRDGGAVPLDDIVAAPSGAPAMPGPAPAEPIAENGDAVLQALRSTERAEELHREAATKAPHEAAVDGMAGLSEAKRRFLRSNPILMRPDIAPIASRVYQDAIASGVEDDSEELEKFILDRTAQDLAARRKLAEGSARHRAEAERLRHEVEELDREAGGFRSEEDQEEPAPEPERAPSRAPVSRPARTRMSVSAPVSRDAPSVSTGRAQTNVDRTLTAAEREIARNSYSALDMTDAEKEHRYWQQREKMRRMRANGTYE